MCFYKCEDNNGNPLVTIFIPKNLLHYYTYIFCRYQKRLLVEIAVLLLFQPEVPGTKGGQHSETFWRRLRKRHRFSYCPIRCSCRACTNTFSVFIQIQLLYLLDILSLFGSSCVCVNSKVLNLQSILLGFQMMLGQASYLATVANLPLLLN